MVKYKVKVRAYNYFMGLPCEPTFEVNLYEQEWALGICFRDEHIIAHSENRDFFKCVEEINDYIIGNKLNINNIEFPDIYRHVKPIKYIE